MCSRPHPHPIGAYLDAVHVAAIIDADHAMTAGTGSLESPGSAERPLTPGEALMKLFLDNADHGRNAANDELIAALRQRAREIQALAGPPPPRRAPRGDRVGSCR